MKITKSMHTADDFKIGMRVGVVCELVDYFQFNGEKGTVEAIGSKYVRVKLDRPIDEEITSFSFLPECLAIISATKEIC